MYPSSGTVPQTPETKTGGGLAGVFKSLTGNRGNKSAAPPISSNATTLPISVQLSRKLSSPKAARGAIFGGPSDYEKLYEQLKPGNPLSERLAAAEALRLAVADYPLRGVRCDEILLFN